MAADQDTEEIVFGGPLVDNQGAGGGEEAIPEADDDDFKWLCLISLEFNFKSFLNL